MPPPLWFTGWDNPQGPVRRLRAEVRCVRPLAERWPDVEPALRCMRLPAGRGMAPTLGLTVRWLDTGTAPIDDASPLLRGGACLVEAVTPLAPA